MLSYIGRRMGQAFAMVVGLSLILFALLQLAPGSPVEYLIPQTVTDPTQRERLIHSLGLDLPVWQQYWNWLAGLFRGDFGTAYTFGQPVLSVIGQRLGPTLQLQLVVILLSIVISILVGVTAAVKRYSIFDHLATSGSLFGLSMPSFWFALMLIMLFSVRLGWLPVAGNGSGGGVFTDWNYFILPVVVLVLALVPWYSRFIRSGMIETLGQDYILTAKAFGIRKSRIYFRYSLKPALLPALTIVGLSLPRLLGGSVVVETIFAWPGLGRLAYDSILRHDFPVVMSLGLLSGAFVMVVNLFIDLLYVAIDPRVTFDGR